MVNEQNKVAPHNQQQIPQEPGVPPQVLKADHSFLSNPIMQKEIKRNSVA
jgi:hypothetical protein